VGVFRPNLERAALPESGSAAAWVIASMSDELIGQIPT
jgi:hypothetical protein